MIQEKEENSDLTEYSDSENSEYEKGDGYEILQKKIFSKLAGEEIIYYSKITDDELKTEIDIYILKKILETFISLYLYYRSNHMPDILIYLFGSFISQHNYKDIDVMLTPTNSSLDLSLYKETHIEIKKIFSIIAIILKRFDINIGVINNGDYSLINHKSGLITTLKISQFNINKLLIKDCDLTIDFNISRFVIDYIVNWDIREELPFFTHKMDYILVKIDSDGDADISFTKKKITRNIVDDYEIHTIDKSKLPIIIENERKLKKYQINSLSGKDFLNFAEFFKYTCLNISQKQWNNIYNYLLILYLEKILRVLEDGYTIIGFISIIENNYRLVPAFFGKFSDMKKYMKYLFQRKIKQTTYNTHCPVYLDKINFENEFIIGLTCCTVIFTIKNFIKFIQDSMQNDKGVHDLQCPVCRTRLKSSIMRLEYID